MAVPDVRRGFKFRYNWGMSFHIRPATPADGPGIAFVRVTTWREAYRGIIPQAYLDGMDIIAEGARRSEILAHPAPGYCALVAELLPAGDTAHAKEVVLSPVGDPLAGEDTRRQRAPTRIAGFAIGGPNRESNSEYTGELYAIYVLPEYQGLGVGRKLFRAMSGWLAGQGHSSMILYVLRDNFPSRRFYEAQGGRPVCEQTIEIGGRMLPEVGYGYDLRPPGGAPPGVESDPASGPDHQGQHPGA